MLASFCVCKCCLIIATTVFHNGYTKVARSISHFKCKNIYNFITTTTIEWIFYHILVDSLHDLVFGLRFQMKVDGNAKN